MIEGHRAASSRTAGRGRCRGFTMVELTVALMAGLIVAMGIVTLSREASNTFNDEMRSSGAEAAARGAIARLRADLERAGFMSTGNILLDPALAHIPGSLAGASNASGYVPTASAPSGGIGMSGLQNFASLFWVDNGSNNGTGGVNNLLTQSSGQSTPDLIQIAGNMTSAEQFDVQYIPSANTACSAGGTVITLSLNAPAMVRTLGGTAPTSGNASTLGLLLQNIFSPDPSYPTASTASFLLRLVDRTAHTQFLAICPATATQASAGIDTTSLLPYIRVDGAKTPILYSTATSSTVSTIGGVSGFCAGCQVNPVQIVQWEITTQGGADNEPSAYLNNLDNQTQVASGDTLKYDLMRSYLDSSGTLVASTSEIVAEYAVDLAFAFSGDSGTNLSPSATTSTTSCAFDDGTCNALWGKRVSSVAANQGPQRIRTVRARITTRASQADRSASIALAPAQYGSQNFMYRYNLGTSPLAYARARTITTEVALPNLARNFY